MNPNPNPSQANQALWEKGDFTQIASSMRESGDAEGRKPKADPMAKRTPGIPGPSACHERPV